MQRLVCSTILSLLASVLASPAFAAAEAHAEKEGLPQLNVSTFPGQIFWLAVTFLLLYWLLRTKALPRVTEILETRQSRIAADLDRATRLREEAEASLLRYQQVVHEAQTKAGTTLRETRERLMADAASRQHEVDAQLGQKIEEADRRIAEAKSKALAELNDVAIQAAQDATQRLIGKTVTREQAANALAAETREAA